MKGTYLNLDFENGLLISCTSMKILVISVDRGGHKTAPLQVNCVGRGLVPALNYCSTSLYLLVQDVRLRQRENIDSEV